MEKDRLFFTINRFDQYYDSVNNKSNIILGISTFLVGGLVALYPTISEKINCTALIHGFLMLLILIGLIVMLVIIFASIPYLTAHNSSVFYFRSVSKMTLSDFSTQSSMCTTDQELADLREQTHSLAKGLWFKFRYLKIACILLFIQFCLFIPFLILLFNNLKP